MDAAADTSYDPEGESLRGDERDTAADLPELLAVLGEASERVGALSLARRHPPGREELDELSGRLAFARHLLEGLFALRAEPVPDPEPGIAFESLGPSLRRTLPQRLAAQLEDERNCVTERTLRDLSSFAALGLHARVVELQRFVAWVETLAAEAARAAAPPTVMSMRRAARPKAAPPAAAPAEAAPPPPAEDAGPDLSAYDLRLDEAGERVDVAGASAWFASAAGPRAAGPGLAASFAVAFPGGIALAVAAGADSSLGARLSAVVAVRTFCRAAAANPSDPLAAIRTAHGHLEMLLAALLGAGDSSEALTRVRGSVAPANARRILAHTRSPEDALRRVPPALASGIVGAVGSVVGGGLKVTAVRLGPGRAELRRAGSTSTLLGPARAEGAAFLGPGARGTEALGRAEKAASVAFARGDALLLSTPALARGSETAWAGLSTLWAPFPDGLTDGSSARRVVERAERWGAAEPGSFDGPLGLALLLAR